MLLPESTAKILALGGEILDCILRTAEHFIDPFKVTGKSIPPGT
ncbi:hypothetical protein SBA5_10042 [Candidatus Sulfotelmatomonas gaucii]|uniref:Uncharacterized protein n=1 Tax=Candidatus Sulfuritelmatomonas gaucii TaxID=2043161 RepID=A0A2N9L200_9BACT|nr:hypothetical protein SBA5_10042 [Candidatus Sulfotelmatomonas gaucii]